MIAGCGHGTGVISVPMPPSAPVMIAHFTSFIVFQFSISFLQTRRQFFIQMFMTSHFVRVHTANAIIYARNYNVHGLHVPYGSKSRFIQQGTCHLNSIKAGIQHFINFLTRNKAALHKLTEHPEGASRNFSASSRKICLFEKGTVGIIHFPNIRTPYFSHQQFI